MSKKALKTIRFNPEESRSIDLFLKQNAFFESFSVLGRIAVMEFIQRRGYIEWQKVVLDPNPNEKPSFIWEYDLTKQQIKEILSQPSFQKKKWLIGKILENAPYPEILEYLTIDEIKKSLPLLRIKPKIKDKWSYAIQVWTQK